MRRASSSDTLVSAYARLRDTLEDYKSLKLLDFKQDACTLYEDLVRQRIRIGTRDLRIAAIVISVEGTLVVWQVSFDGFVVAL